MFDEFDVETICLYRFGNMNQYNMNAVMVFLSQNGIMSWDVAGSFSRGFIAAK